MARFRQIIPILTEFSNLPRKYIEREMFQGTVTENLHGLWTTRVRQRRNWRFTTYRPWTEMAKQQNNPGVYRKKVFVEPIREWNFYRGDRVEILVGKDKGKQGIVDCIVSERNWVFVQGLNCTVRVIKQPGMPTVAQKIETPLLVTSEVALVDPSDNKPCSVEWRYTEAGERVRVSTRTNRLIPRPAMAEETKDYKKKDLYKDGDKDTSADELKLVTFQPSKKTFEQDLMDKRGIVETRKPAPTFWY